MRTRFPPSPTGFLHIGGLRTALYSYLLAKQSGDAFTLRIEDTDQERSVPGAIENIVRTLDWAGISATEGVMLENGKIVQKGEYGPYIQSQRLDIYKKFADELLKKGHAYHCFCTKERLDAMRAEQQAAKQAPMYDRLCVSLSQEEIEKRIAAGEPHVLRMKIPREETIEFVDAIRGKLSFQGSTIDDQVLLKSDGFPTYHLAHVVDDHLMKTDLVTRGEEWLSSTPKHLLLFRFLGWEAPHYAHVPLLLNKDRSKLSKRQADVAAEDYKEKGYLPEAIINFLALLGWNPGTTQELFSLEELVKEFSLERVQKSGAIFDLEKLDWLQGQWIRKIPLADFTARVLSEVEKKYPAAKDDATFDKKAASIQERLLFFKDAPEMLSFFYEEPNATEELLVNEKQGATKDILPKVMPLLIDSLKDLSEEKWTNDGLKDYLFEIVEKNELKRGQLLWPMRAALSGKPFSPGAFELAEALGKETTLKRLEAAKKLIAG